MADKLNEIFDKINSSSNIWWM